jgi:hypothetical protein
MRAHELARGSVPHEPGRLPVEDFDDVVGHGAVTFG